MKKYMGVWSLESLQINTMRMLFPKTVNVYMIRKSTNRTSRMAESEVNPNRMNSDSVRLLLSMDVKILTLKDRKEVFTNYYAKG